MVEGRVIGYITVSSSENPSLIKENYHAPMCDTDTYTC